MPCSSVFERTLDDRQDHSLKIYFYLFITASLGKKTCARNHKKFSVQYSKLERTQVLRSTWQSPTDINKGEGVGVHTDSSHFAFLAKLHCHYIRKYKGYIKYLR